MIIKPRLSEKTYILSQTGTYVFDVPKSANKQTVAKAVEDQFKVAVTNVNIMNKLGKSKRSIRKRGQIMSGSEIDSKRAYVTLKTGDKISLFEEGGA